MYAGKTTSRDNSSPSPAPRPFARMRKRRRTLSTDGPVQTQIDPPPTIPTLFTVRPNPSHFVINVSEGSTSTERQVVDALVKEDARCVSVVGLPGSGKTVLLRAVAHCSEVRKVFRDCVALLGLMDATADSLLRDLCEVVGRVCGLGKQVSIQNMLLRPNSHESAIQEVARAFSGRRVLLLFDAVGTMESLVSMLVSKFAETAKSDHSPLSILLSTRSVAVANALCKGKYSFLVKLLDPCESRAKDIICAHAGFNHDTFEVTCKMKDNSVLPVMQKCSGLPIALAVAGGAVKRLLLSATDEQSRAIIWAHYRKYLYNNFDQFGEISGLYRSLRACAKSVASLKTWPKGISVREALAALKDMKSDLWIPLAVLQRLWKLEGREQVVAAVDCLADFCLVSRVDRRKVIGIQIPAIVLDYCRYEAKDLRKPRTSFSIKNPPGNISRTNGKKDNRRAPPKKTMENQPADSATLVRGKGSLAVAHSAKDDHLWLAKPDRNLISR